MNNSDVHLIGVRLQSINKALISIDETLRKQNQLIDALIRQQLKMHQTVNSMAVHQQAAEELASHG